MFGRMFGSRASWTLADQAVVSLGTFGGNIVLARYLPPAEYGVYAVIFGGLLVLQIVNSTLVSYPLTIQAAKSDADRGHLTFSSLAMVAIFLVPLSLLITCGLSAFGKSDLLFAALAWFWCWQAQEAVRRVLFAELRHRDAIAGDAVSYLGQAACVLLLARAGALTLPTAMAAMAATSLAGAVIQYFQITHRLQWPRLMIAAIRAHWMIGRWSMASNLVTTMRVQILIWLVAVAASSAMAAEFQASFNITNLVNPVLLGLCNLIPAVAAHASNAGVGGAWRETRYYGLLGCATAGVYYLLVAMWPELVLRIFYGDGSPYLTASAAVRILAAAYLINFVTELICAFMHGINSSRTALIINLLGAATAVAAVGPLVLGLGWSGAYWALLLANVVRLAAALNFLKQVISHAAARTI